MVALGCGYKCLQIILIILNAVILACGVGLIVVGSLAESSLETFGDSGDPTIRAMVISVICLGCVIFLIGLFGFCGACLKSAWMLILYVILLSIVTVGLIASGIAGLVLRQEVPGLISRKLLSIYSQYGKNQHVTKILDEMQKTLKCCGQDGTWSGGVTPNSCLDEQNVPFTKGCEQAFAAFLQENLVLIAITIFIIAFVQVICMVFAACIFRAINDDAKQTA